MHERHDSPFPRPNSPRRHAAAWAICLAASLAAQQSQEPPAGGPPPNFEPGSSPGRGGPGFGPEGGPAAEREQQLVEQFDADKSGKLDDAERKEARAFVKSQPRRGMGGPGGRGGRGGRGGFPGSPPPNGEDAANAAPRTKKQIAHGDVQTYADQALYEPSVIRTIFLQFPQSDWFEELADFYRTDVEVPAAMHVDGKDYAGVGVGFRGNSSYFGVQGKKKSFSITVDFTDPKQKLNGYGELNLLNCNDDPSYLREAIHAFVARGYMPALQANLVQVVVNGENWGLYANVQQFDKAYLDESFGTKKGVRFKVPANPRGGAGLAWLGDDRKAYEAAYELKGSLDGEAKDAAWSRLIEACRILNTTPVDQLEAALPAVLDVDATLWFLAVDAALLDGDGYASRASDFLLWESPEGRFRPLPYDSNEILGNGGGPGGMRGRRGAPPADARGGEGQPRDRG
ncbi:MAG: Inner spore coat protein, partial [Planctomycetota bacterium]